MKTMAATGLDQVHAAYPIAPGLSTSEGTRSILVPASPFPEARDAHGCEHSARTRQAYAERDEISNLRFLSMVRKHCLEG